VGTDINPLAVFLANAKLRALTIPADRVLREGTKCCQAAKRLRRYPKSEPERAAYLQSWFSDEYLNDVERLKAALASAGDDVRPVLLSIGSNLLRDYSLQEPQDLRIRRRKAAYPRISLFDAFEKELATFCGRLAETQATLGILQHKAHAIESDCRTNVSQTVRGEGLYDAVLTSPPYATALPYIDTQRLSLVWLDLLPPTRILALESELLGSREVRSTQRRALTEMVATNENALPSGVAHLCKELLRAIGPQDGFRRKAVPGLLYRYFSGMADVFGSVREVTKKGGPFALVVGANHTILGGTRFDIDTPRLLVELASTRGWDHVETVPLQTYQRFGLHASNSTTREALVILRAR
jgi:site-specific DNA-methyltransferase (cytosine-N4-specific)